MPRAAHLPTFTPCIALLSYTLFFLFPSRSTCSTITLPFTQTRQDDDIPMLSLDPSPFPQPTDDEQVLSPSPFTPFPPQSPTIAPIVQPQPPAIPSPSSSPFSSPSPSTTPTPSRSPTLTTIGPAPPTSSFQPGVPESPIPSETQLFPSDLSNTDETEPTDPQLLLTPQPSITPFPSDQFPDATDDAAGDAATAAPSETPQDSPEPVSAGLTSGEVVGIVVSSLVLAAAALIGLVFAFGVSVPSSAGSAVFSEAAGTGGATEATGTAPNAVSNVAPVDTV